MKKIIIYLLLITCATEAFSQLRKIQGTVSEIDGMFQKKPIEFVNVYLSGTSTGTITGADGSFSLDVTSDGEHLLVISFVGYLNDTIEVVPGPNDIDVILSAGQELDEVSISKRLGGSYISRMKPIKTEVITEAGLQKLPCCNLSESFENSATIDVGYSDAVTGAKHIKMLGLAGVYSQMLFENIPYLRGLESSFGLNYVPGPWMESIQISKGAAAVINGYESTTGQINLEYKKPETGDPLFLNLFTSSTGRLEANLISAIPVNDKWRTMIMAHASSLQNKIDRNKDSFLDVPLTRQVNILNRWKYNPEGNLRVQLGFSFLNEIREGGQIDFDYDRDYGTDNYYGMTVDTRKFNGFGKIGLLFPEKPYSSIGFQTSATLMSMKGLFGLDEYSGQQMSLYSNLIFQSIIGSTNHTYNIGASFLSDRYEEVLNSDIFSRTEIVPGIFGQYTYTNLDKFNGILGLRVDNNSVYGLLVTPRMHLRYTPDQHTSLRASAGRGYRSVNVLSENLGIVASSRTFFFLEDFDIEKAWNYGLNVTRSFHLNAQREANVSLDFYRTDFQNQVVVDVDRDVSGVYFYNLDGRSWSNSFQAEINIQPLERFDITAAFRFSDVKKSFNGNLREVPLTTRYKGLLNLSYATWYNKWSFDLTTQLNGQSRLPDTGMNPVEYQRDDYSPQYIILHAQLTRRFKRFDIYVGGENLTDFRQEDPILAAGDPFGEYFDASMVWGPLLGRSVYAGLRLTLK